MHGWSGKWRRRWRYVILDLVVVCVRECFLRCTFKKRSACVWGSSCSTNELCRWGGNARPRFLFVRREGGVASNTQHRCCQHLSVGIFRRSLYSPKYGLARLLVSYGIENGGGGGQTCAGGCVRHVHFASTHTLHQVGFTALIAFLG